MTLMTLIVYHSHKHELQADSRVTLWSSTDAHQCYTPAALYRAYLEEPDHTLFLIRVNNTIIASLHVPK